MDSHHDPRLDQFAVGRTILFGHLALASQVEALLLPINQDGARSIGVSEGAMITVLTTEMKQVTQSRLPTETGSSSAILADHPFLFRSSGSTIMLRRWQHLCSHSWG
jgi:hypothetical protein